MGNQSTASPHSTLPCTFLCSEPVRLRSLFDQILARLHSGLSACFLGLAEGPFKSDQQNHVA